MHILGGCLILFTLLVSRGRSSWNRQEAGGRLGGHLAYGLYPSYSYSETTTTTTAGCTSKRKAGVVYYAHTGRYMMHDANKIS